LPATNAGHLTNKDEVMDTVFYSWQSDLDQKTNRFFIGDALEKAVKLLRREGLEVAPRIEQDARDCPGSPDLAAEILKKINKCRVFVADVSIINSGAVVLAPGKNPGGVEIFSLWERAMAPKPDDLKRCRPTPNPNVLIELGYAARSVTWDRVICVFNGAYGEIEELPFDIRPRGMLRFDLLPTDEEERKRKKDELQAILKGALEVAIARTEAERAEQERLAEAEARQQQEARTQAHGQREKARQDEFLRKLRQHYMLTTKDNIAPGIASGIDPLPKEWVELELQRKGENWRRDVYY
jgi:hypothetical protein